MTGSFKKRESRRKKVSQMTEPGMIGVDIAIVRGSIENVGRPPAPAHAALDRIQAENERLRWVVQTGLCLECGTHFRDMPVARFALSPKETQ